MDRVILLHGLWAPAFVMSPLAARLGAAGFGCRLFRYAGRRDSLEANAARLQRFASAVGPAHFVGHSLGGLVILRALNAMPELRVRRVVLLGTPSCGSVAGRRLGGHRIGRWLLGRSAAQWGEHATGRWDRVEPLGVIAGTLPVGLGRVVSRLPGPSDGVVCVEETEVQGMRERVLLPVSHSAMIVSARVAKATASFLRHGSFGDVAG